MIMISYDEAKDKPEAFRALTGLELVEFEQLLDSFESAYRRERESLTRNAQRQRKPGGGRQASLSTIEDKLFFILFYFKNYPLQEIIGFLFGFSQSQANEWPHRLTTILTAALKEGGYLPERCPKHLQAILSNYSNQEFAIDGTERKRQRPSAPNEQKQYYSGKKKAHTVKNDIIVEVASGYIDYLSRTVEGKKHDKKIVDEEELVFPPNSCLYQDSGFQGYKPEGVLTYQPHKKPRGGKLRVGDQFFNSIISSTRIVVEHVIAGIKRCHIVKDIFRNTKTQFNDIVMEIACGLHNFRTLCRTAKNDENLIPIFL
jgi:hypothetical protein